MIFGDKADFAIEAMVEPDLKLPSAVWGRMRVWCDSTPIGDFDNPYCALFPAYGGFSLLLGNLDSLWRTEFADKSDIELWDRLDRLLFSQDPDADAHDLRTVEQMQEDWHDYGDFVFLTNWGEQFDRGGKSYIFAPPNGAVMILNGALLESGGKALQVSKKGLLAAVQQFVEWFDAEAVRLRR